MRALRLHVDESPAGYFLICDLRPNGEIDRRITVPAKLDPGIASGRIFGLGPAWRSEREDMDTEALKEACSMLPDGASWGDPVTPEMVLTIAEAARGDMRDELARLHNDCDRMSDWLEGDCCCPCCNQDRVCVDECSLREDDPASADRIDGARAARFGA